MIQRKASNLPGLNDAGFTLIEIMAAMICFAIVALALSTMNATTWTQTSRAKTHTEASVLASQHLESLFSEKYAGEDENNSMSAAVKAGMKTLRQDGWRKVKAGVTGLSEVLRVSHADELLAKDGGS